MRLPVPPADMAVPPDVVTVVDSAAELKATAYSRQGDMLYHTPDAFALRGRLRDAPAVVAALDAFWDAATFVDDETYTPAPSVSREKYLRIWSKIGLVLYRKYREDDVSEEAAQCVCSQSARARDSQHSESSQNRP